MLTLISVLHNAAMAFILKNKGGTGSNITELRGLTVVQARLATDNNRKPDQCCQLGKFVPKPASFPNPSWQLKLSKATSDKTRDFFCPEPSPVSRHSAGQSHCVAAAAADLHRSRATNDVCLRKAAPLSLWIKFDILTFYLHEHLDRY